MTATPNEGYKFVGWYVESKLYSTDATYTFEAFMNATYTAKFEEKAEDDVSLVIKYDKAALTLIGSQAGWYKKGDTIAENVIVKTGIVFTGWKKNGSDYSSSRPISFTIEEDTILEATYKVESSPIPVDPSGGGGGGGSGIPDSDTIPSDDKANNADSLITSAGIYTVWCPTNTQLEKVGDVMYSQSMTGFMEDIITKIGSLGGAITDYMFKGFHLPVALKSEYRKSGKIMVGWYKTDTSCDRTDQWTIVNDFGTIEIPRYYGNALDYRAQIQLYLPYIGYCPIDAVSVVGKTLGVVYYTSVATGDVVAHITVDGNEHYQFTGNMASEMPISNDSSLVNGLTNVAGKVASTALTGGVGAVVKGG